MYITCILPALRPKRPEGKCVRGLDFGLLGRNSSVYWNKKHSGSSFLSSNRSDITENRSTYLSICVCDRFNRYFTRVWAHICAQNMSKCGAIMYTSWYMVNTNEGRPVLLSLIANISPKWGKWLYSDSIILVCLHCYSVAIGLST